MSERTEKATLGGGCFWCLEAVFAELQGVISVLPGYAGGHVPEPGYEAVCTGDTGHAEVLEVTYSPDLISYREILEVFFFIHDPTTPNRQVHDVGTQYRSVIFVHSAAQEVEAAGFVEELRQNGVFAAPIVTEVLPLPTFYPAEDYHRGYFERNPRQGYCQVVIAPKLSGFRRKFASRLKPPR